MNSLSIVDPSEKAVSLENSTGSSDMQRTSLSEKGALLPLDPDGTKVMFVLRDLVKAKRRWLSRFARERTYLQVTG